MGDWSALSCFCSYSSPYGVIPAFFEEPESGREAESPPDLWFPHHCGCLLLCSCIFIYVRPAKTFYIDKSLTVFYTVITPMLNPLIYSLRNSELTYAMKKLWKKTSYPILNKCIIHHEGSHLTSKFILFKCKGHLKVVLISLSSTSLW